MNPLLKFIVKRLEGKLTDLQQFTDQVDNFEAFQVVIEDMEVYFDELKSIVGEVL
ncbi:MAG: hypothetical protein K0Q73_6752 [Paenibacillus sp.]|jgi:hypothetical protein|nr:hypothetical protein [Paenibacillus sp.]